MMATLLLLCCALVGCGEKNTAQPAQAEVEADEKPKPVTLTTDNIDDYISVRGEYKNGDYHSALLFYVSTADLDLQAYSTATGTFDNVEITVEADLSEKAGMLSEKWHLVDSENESRVEITFKMPSNGDYSSTYGIECNRATWKLSGSANLKIVSVSGTFTPKN